MILFIICTPAGNWLFGAAPLGADVWLRALAGRILEEMRRAWHRCRLSRGA